MKALFWNLNGKPLERLVAQIAAERDRDFIVLVETGGISEANLVVELSKAVGQPFCYHYQPKMLQPRLKFFSRYSHNSMQPLHDSTGIALRRMHFPGCQPIIVGGIHSPSRMYWDQPDDRWALANRIRVELEDVELSEQHRRSVLIGDFNSDPFEAAVINSETLHAVMSRKTAMETSRIVGGEERRFLYNPMWSMFGDRTAGPPGSYYYRRSNSSCHFWHLFDQVLLRPELTKTFRNESLEIVTEVSATSLAREDGTPDRDAASDHFPFVFSLDLMQEFPDVG